MLIKSTGRLSSSELADDFLSPSARLWSRPRRPMDVALILNAGPAVGAPGSVNTHKTTDTDTNSSPAPSSKAPLLVRGLGASSHSRTRTTSLRKSASTGALDIGPGELAGHSGTSTSPAVPSLAPSSTQTQPTHATNGPTTTSVFVPTSTPSSASIPGHALRRHSSSTLRHDSRSPHVRQARPKPKEPSKSVNKAKLQQYRGLGLAGTVVPSSASSPSTPQRTPNNKASKSTATARTSTRTRTASARTSDRPSRTTNDKIKSRRSSTVSSSSSTSHQRDRERDRAMAVKLLSQAREQVAAEKHAQQQQQQLLGLDARRPPSTTSIMDVVMELRGPAVDLEDVCLIIDWRLQHNPGSSYGNDNLLLGYGGGDADDWHGEMALAAYWDAQAALWEGFDVEIEVYSASGAGTAGEDDEDLAMLSSTEDSDMGLLRYSRYFPVSMERSTIGFA
uniref:Uncharacterized protein n=1 Tax=Mycena chlorophos TaxID=658473 RepID=A0ABQ0LSY9_MYCCL|nr:predicted protein [Mycena chlorophos]